MFVPAYVEIAGNERADFGQYGVQCTIGCSGFASSRETDNVGRMAE
jgi:hypothetical protein